MSTMAISHEHRSTHDGGRAVLCAGERNERRASIPARGRHDRDRAGVHLIPGFSSLNSGRRSGVGRLSLGWMYRSASEFLELRALTLAGVDATVAAQIINPHSAQNAPDQPVEPFETHAPAPLPNDHSERPQEACSPIQGIRFPE